MLQSRTRVQELTNLLVQTQSIVNSPGEITMAQKIYALLSELPYFKKHPEQLLIAQTDESQTERYNVLAFVKGTKQTSANTVILMGHLDTVGIDDYNHLKPYACNPEILMERLKKESLSPLVKEHIESDEWLFGRGVLDMKAGVASHMYLLEYFSERTDELCGNILFIAECDEEDGSNGILSALKILKRWREEYGFNYVAAINADFVSPRSKDDPNRYIYKGTVGKLLPSFFVTGAESHVGSCFEGLDPNFLVAELTKQINYNPELCNEAYGEITVPPVSLKQTDLKPTYTVQTALSAYAYYNFFIHSWSPKEVLEKLVEQAKIAFSNALDSYKERYKKYCQISGEVYQEPEWQVKVITFEEMDKQLTELHGKSYIQHMTKFKGELLKDPSIDTRMFSARVVEEAFQWMEDKSPTMILFYSSLYSPRIEVVGKNDLEKNLIQALEKAVDLIQPAYPNPIVVRNYFPYISDMSFVALSDDEAGIEAVIHNNPSWGSKHYVHYQDVRDLNVPVINIGPYGYDAHNKYERAELHYSFEIVPNLTHQVIKQLFEQC